MTLYQELLQRKKYTDELKLKAASFFRSEFPRKFAAFLQCPPNRIKFELGNPSTSDCEVKYNVKVNVHVTDCESIDFSLDLNAFTYKYSMSDNAAVTFDGVTYKMDDEMFFQDLISKVADSEFVKI